MTETIIENLSGRKLAVFVTFLLLSQLACFLVGGLIAIKPGNLQNILGTVCADTSGMDNDTSKWFYNTGNSSTCQLVGEIEAGSLLATDMVYTFQMPIPRENKSRNYLRWQQNLVGVMQVDIRKHSHSESRSIMTLDARLAYRDKEDPEGVWNLYAQALEKRNLDCEIIKNKTIISCKAVPLFELSYLSHYYYLLNVKLPVDPIDVGHYLGHVENIWLTVINQDESYTAVWVTLKTIFFFTFIVTLWWFCRRILKLKRNFRLLEKLLVSLGLTNCLLAMPMEYLTLYVEMPLMVIFGDIRQLVLYAKLFFFWLVFAGEHMLIEADTSFKHYWKHMLLVVLSCIFIFIFDIYERCVQLKNPFYTIWMTDLGFDLDLGFVTITRIVLGLYFLFICYKFSKVFANIHRKRQLYVVNKNPVRRLHYEGIVYRFKIVIVATIICAALTVINIMIGQVADWKVDENIKLVKYTSVFFTGVYGTWNLYIFALLILYAPSEKQWDGSKKDSVNLYKPN